MSPIETFFAFSFVSSLAVALLATWWYSLPKLISLYRLVAHQ